MAQIKASIGHKRVILAEAVPISTPFSVYIFVTNLCNFKCFYCGHSLGTEKMRQEYEFLPTSMDMDTFQKTIDQLAEFDEKIQLLSLTGHGEPLLHQKLPEMIAYAKQKQVAKRIEIISNGSLLNRELTDQLLQAGLDGMRISLQGLSSKKYQEVCGFSLDFDQWKEQIAYFYEKKGTCDLFLKIMDVALEAGEEELFYEMFDPICDRMFIEECRPVYAGVKATEGISITKDRYGMEHAPRKVCPLCFFMLGILPNGEVKPCDSVYRPVRLGNVTENSLKEIWQGETLKKFRLQQLKMQRDQMKYCAVCCAPDDVSQPEDCLDEAAEEIIRRLGNV